MDIFKLVLRVLACFIFIFVSYHDIMVILLVNCLRKDSGEATQKFSEFSLIWLKVLTQKCLCRTFIQVVLYYNKEASQGLRKEIGTHSQIMGILWKR